MTDKPKPKANIRFLYAFCNDIKPIRAFYTDLLGMEETSHMDEDRFGWLAYQCDGLQYMFFRWDSELPIEARWACQPGEEINDSAGLMNFSLEYGFDDFQKLVPQVIEAGGPVEKPKPTWRQSSYWGWTIKDPMGNTIEVYSAPKEKPAEDAPVWG
ncbi:hypothetical protein OAU50_02725 [Planctomycetota bacterium]|nr:hypothetical protein [Planctomycetota bacterium]